MRRRAMRGTTRLGISTLAGVLAVGGSLVIAAPRAGASYGSTERVSVDVTGGELVDGVDAVIAASGSGRFVAFSSSSDQVVAGDTNAVSDVFVRDRSARTNERVSISTSGAQANDGASFAAMTPDGGYVVFTSRASNLVVGDTNNSNDVFVRDRTAGTTERVFLSNAGAQASDGPAGTPPVISADGRYVAFVSATNDLVAGDTNDKHDVFVRDRVAGTTTRVSVSSGGVQSNDHSEGLSMSADGRYVAYTSQASNLVTGDTNGSSDVFVRDTTLGTTERVNLSSAGAEASSSSASAVPRISADGRFVAFTSLANNLIPADATGFSDVYLRDRVAATTELVSMNSSGAQANSISYDMLSMSDDGNRILFKSPATNLVPGDTSGGPDLFLRDRAAGTTERVNLDDAGNQVTEPAQTSQNEAAISGNGATVAFATFLPMVAGDANENWDVFVRDDGELVAPSGGLATPAAGAVYQQGAAATVDFACQDQPGGSGVVSCTGDAPAGSALDTTTPGTHSFSVTAVDAAGNTATDIHTYLVDGAAPTVSFTSPGAGAHYAIGEFVRVTYTCTDEVGGSGIASCVGSVPSGTQLDTYTTGPASVSVTATDRSGRTATVLRSYVVDPWPVVTVGSASVAEGNAGTRVVNVPVTLNAPRTHGSSVEWATADNSAVAPSDYVAASGTIYFDAGETTKVIPVTVRGDLTIEPDQVFLIALSNPYQATIGGYGFGVVRITDDDRPAISVADVSVTEGNTGTKYVTFTLSLSSAVLQPVTVSFATANGTASAPSDYTAASGTATFAAKKRSATVKIAVVGDKIREPNETFLLKLSNASPSVRIADASGSATIVNND